MYVCQDRQVNASLSFGAYIEEGSISHMEAIEVHCTSNRICPHVRKDNPISIPQEGQRVLSDDSVKTITGRSKQGRPVHCLVFFFRHMGQMRVSQPADARVGMVIDNAVEGAVQSITNVVVKHFVASCVFAHSGAVYVEQ